MSSVQQIQESSDIRGAAQDYKRDAAHKHKWAHPVPAIRSSCGKPSDKFKPRRTSSGMGNRMKTGIGKTKNVRQQDMLSAATPAENPDVLTSDDSNVSADEEHDPSAPVASLVARRPGSGSQILNTALAKAIEKYEDKETVKLVRKEYEMVDEYDDQEAMGLSPVKRKNTNTKGKVIPYEDQEYEFV